MHDEQPASEPESGSLFIPDAKELRRVAEEIAAEFPPPRLGTELVLLDVDPHRTHAYWNVDTADFDSATKLAASPGAPMVLRFTEVSADPAAASKPPFDVEVQGLQNHWYVDLWQPGRSYVAELGLLCPDGHLVVLARSNRVDTPPAAQSEHHDLSGADSRDQDVGAVTADLAEAAQTRADARAEARAMPAPEIMINRYPEAQPAAAQPPAAPPARLPPVGPWPTAEQLVQFLPDPAPLMESIAAQADRAAAAEPAAPAPAAPRSEPGPSAPPAPAAAALDQYVNLSSFVNGRSDVALEVNVELHVYGRARPGSRLTFYGQEVPVRPDGTFSIRKPLPQGAVVLPLVLQDGPGKES